MTISISTTYLSETATGGTIVATLGSSDNATSFTLLNPDQSIFEVVEVGGAWVLRVKADGYFNLEDYSGGNPAYELTVIADGGAAGAYSESFTIHIRDEADPLRLAYSLEIVPSEGVRVNKSVVTALSDGRYLVAWQTYSDTSVENEIRGQIFNADGTPWTASDFAINTTLNNAQRVPSITAIDGGRFVTVWQDHSGTSPDISGAQIRGRVFNNDGSSVTAVDFRINTTMVLDQLNPSVAAISGGFVVVWQDASAASPDTS